jgi:hypothetical protein
MQVVESISIQSEAVPTTPPSAKAIFESKAEQHHDQHHNLPSPPTSVSKTQSHHSNEDVDMTADTSIEGSHIKTGEIDKRDEADAISKSDEYRSVPPSPPPSTHSSEDSHTPIRPSYFYPQPADVEAAGVTSSTLAEDAPGIPVFEPTWEEFKDFYTFCQRIDEWGMKTGIVKIIPPKEWTESLPRLDGRSGTTSMASDQSTSGSRYTENNLLSQIRIKNSIEQIFTPAGSGSWRQSNVVHPARVLNAKQWADVCSTASQKGPEMSRMKENAKRQEVEGLEEDGVRTRSGRGNRVASGPMSSLAPRKVATKRKRIAEDEKSQEETKVEIAEESKIDSAENILVEATTDDMPDLEEGDAVSKSKLKMADRTTQQEWDEFDYVEGWCQEAGQDSKPTDWNPSVCKAIESEYWRGLNFGKAPMYGADLKGTLFTSTTQHWNVGCLDNILTRLRLRRKLPGVTTPYLYFGMWRATFAWHVEDMDLYSINYIHFGAPKQWYAIRQSDRQRFELAMAGAFPGDSARCKHFMRHKSYLASPAFLAATAGIKPLRLVQKAQEFVITYPYGYHSGFNLGYNCAESVNFALESWLDIGRKAGYCDCANDSVKMDVDAMLEESKEMEELDRKREERERKREADDKLQASELERLEIRRAKERERRKARKEEYARLEALGLLPPGYREDTYDDESPAPPSKKAKTQSLPCVFCPSSSHEDLVVIPYTEEEAEQGKKPMRRAHRLCACFLPETWVAPNPKWQEGNKEPSEVVMGFSGIEKARWSLKCQSCLDPSMVKRGAKVQCTYGKCSRTTHVSCALYTTSGWMLDMLGDTEADVLEGKIKKATKEAYESVGSNLPDNSSREAVLLKQEGDMDAQEMQEGDKGGEEKLKGNLEAEEGPVRIVILCRSHNPREREKEVRRRAEILRRCVETLTVDQTIKVRMGSGVWETVLKEIRWVDDRSGEGEVIVDDGQSCVKWSKIMFDEELVKKAGEEQRRIEEEEMAALQPEVAIESVRSRNIDDEAKMQIKREKEEAKAAEAERKEMVKKAKEEERRIKEALKMEKIAEKAAKAAEREALAVIKAQKRAEREAKKAERLAKLPKVNGQMQNHVGYYNQASFVNAASPDTASRPSQKPEYDYIRQWQPSLLHPRPVLPGSTSSIMDRTLHPIWQQQQQRPNPATYSPATSTSNGYPAHLATYQSRPLQHPMYTMHQQQHQQQQQHNPQYMPSANGTPESHFTLPSHYLSRPQPDAYAAYYQQQQLQQQQQQQAYYRSQQGLSLPMQQNSAPKPIHPHYTAHQAPAAPVNRLQTEESSERAIQH